MPSNNTINSIQLVRAIAVILVVHAHVMDAQPTESFQRQFFYLQNFGAVGVDLFFVVSGFIITVISSRYAIQKKGWFFIKKRMARVLPLYWLVTFLSVALLYLHNRAVYTVSSILKSITLFPLGRDTEQTKLILFQAWTLYFEMFFYLVTGVALLVWGRRYRLVILLFFIAMMAVNYSAGNNNVLLVFLGNGIMLEFLLGMLAGSFFLSVKSTSPLLANSMIFCGIAALVLSLFIGYGKISEAGNTLDGVLSVQRSLVWGIPCFLLVCGLALREKTKPVQVFSFWTAIGDASFSIYLTHVLTLSSVYVRWQSWGLQNKVQPDWQIIISIAIIVGAGCCFYVVAERPLLRLVRNAISRNKKENYNNKFNTG